MKELAGDLVFEMFNCMKALQCKKKEKQLISSVWVGECVECCDCMFEIFGSISLYHTCASETPFHFHSFALVFLPYKTFFLIESWKRAEKNQSLERRIFKVVTLSFEILDLFRSLAYCGSPSFLDLTYVLRGISFLTPLLHSCCSLFL